MSRAAAVNHDGIATRLPLTILLSLIAVTSHAYGQTRQWTLNNGRVSRTLTFDAKAGWLFSRRSCLSPCGFFGPDSQAPLVMAGQIHQAFFDKWVGLLGQLFDRP